MSDQYSDIINMPHHVSRTRAQMPIHNRAAQFAPFDALKGLKEAIKERAERKSRISRRELSEEQ